MFRQTVYVTGYTEAELIVTTQIHEYNVVRASRREPNGSRTCQFLPTFNPSFPNLFFISRETINVSPRKLIFLVARGISSAG